jgi:hypothetical protein
MSKSSKTARSTVSSLAAALVVLLGASVSANAGSFIPGKQPVQIAAQQLKVQPRPSGPGRPALPKHLSGTAGAGASANVGCHDGASQTSYEGPCDNHPEYEATGGCESSAEQASVPGNCPNSSEP